MDRKLGGLILAALLTGCATQPSKMTPEQSAALMRFGQAMLNNSGYSTTPRTMFQAPPPAATQPAPVTTRTTCNPMSNGLVYCTTTFSDGSPPVITSCRYLSNGTLTCS